MAALAAEQSGQGDVFVSCCADLNLERLVQLVDDNHSALRAVLLVCLRDYLVVLVAELDLLF